jgi:hypothetical protein
MPLSVLAFAKIYNEFMCEDETIHKICRDREHWTKNNSSKKNNLKEISVNPHLS